MKQIFQCVLIKYCPMWSYDARQVNPFEQMPNLAKSHPFLSLYNSKYEHHRDLNNGLNEAGHLYQLRYQLYLYLNYVNKLN